MIGTGQRQVQKMNWCALPETNMYGTEILQCINLLQISNFKGVKMRDEMTTCPPKPKV